tara:strand:- start:509 stop:1540 length:1032 start_codon:yes stop_codon:yes gene_type:complete
MPSITNIEVSDLPKNRSIVSTDGVTYIDTRKISFKDIATPVDKVSKKANSARQGDEDGKHIADLRYSFSNGVDINQPPPCVEILEDGVEDDGVVKFFRLLDGFHRFAALCESVDEYVFDVFEIAPDKAEKARVTFQLKTNNHKPSKKSSTDDIVANGTSLMKMKKFDLNEELDTDLVADWVYEVTNSSQSSNKNKDLVTKICQQGGVHLPYQNYPDRAANRWVKKHLPQVKLNEDGGHWWIMKKASDRSFMRMLKKETDQVQYIILNPEPSSAGDVPKARKNLYDYIMQLGGDVAKKLKADPSKLNEVYKIVYALPQLRDSEKMDEPVLMDSIGENDENTLRA